MIAPFKYYKINTNNNSLGMENIFGDAYIMKMPGTGWVFKEIGQNQQTFTLFLQDPLHKLEAEIDFVDNKLEKIKQH